MTKIRDILLREIDNGDLITKGSELTNAEFDNNIVAIYNAAKAILNPNNFQSYSGTKTYSKDAFVNSDDIIYKSLVDNNLNNTPDANPLKWEEAGEDEIFSEANITIEKGITAYASGGQANATQLTESINKIDTAVTDASVKAKTARVRGYQLAWNRTSKTIKFYPQSGEQFASEQDAPDVPINILPGQIIEIRCFVEGIWEIISVENPSERILQSDLLSVSAASIYNVALKKLTIPATSIHASKITLTAELYVSLAVYAMNKIVKSNGADGGVLNKCYKNLTGVNLSTIEGPNWAFADAAGENVGNIEIETFGSPNTLSENHDTRFEVEDISVKVIATSFGSSPDIQEGEIALDFNADVVIQEIGFLTLDNINGVSRNTARGLIP